MYYAHQKANLIFLNSSESHQTETTSYHPDSSQVGGLTTSLLKCFFSLLSEGKGFLLYCISGPVQVHTLQTWSCVQSLCISKQLQCG